MEIKHSVERWLSLDDKIVLDFLEGKLVQIYREGEKPIRTTISFYCFDTSSIPDKRIAVLETASGTVLADTDWIGVEVDKDSLKKLSSNDL